MLNQVFGVSMLGVGGARRRRRGFLLLSTASFCGFVLKRQELTPKQTYLRTGREQCQSTNKHQKAIAETVITSNNPPAPFPTYSQAPAHRLHSPPFCHRHRKFENEMNKNAISFQGNSSRLVIPGWEASQSGAQVKVRHLGLPGADPQGPSLELFSSGGFPS